MYELDNIPQNLPANSAASDHDDVRPSTHHHLCVVRSLRLKISPRCLLLKWIFITFLHTRIEKDQWLVVVFCAART